MSMPSAGTSGDDGGDGGGDNGGSDGEEAAMTTSDGGERRGRRK